MARSGSNHKGGNSASGLGRIVSGTELAGIVGTSRQTITAYAKAGMPVHDNEGQRGAARYNTAEAIKWISKKDMRASSESDEDYEQDIDEIYRLTALTKLKQEEIKLARDQERYADIDAVLNEFSGALSNVRAALMKLPTYAAQLEHQDALAIEKKLTTKMEHILRELSEYEQDEEA